MALLKDLLEKEGIEYTEREFSTDGSIADLAPNPFVSQTQVSQTQLR